MSWILRKQVTTFFEPIFKSSNILFPKVTRSMRILHLLNCFRLHFSIWLVSSVAPSQINRLRHAPAIIMALTGNIISTLQPRVITFSPLYIRTKVLHFDETWEQAIPTRPNIILPSSNMRLALHLKYEVFKTFCLENVYTTAISKRQLKKSCILMSGLSNHFIKKHVG